MVTTAQALPKRSLAALLDRCVDALTGPRRRVAVTAALLAYGAIWTAYRLISTLPRDIHFDMSELYAWSLTPAFGYEKHPPLSAFVVKVWFAVFPVDDWSFTLLTALNIVLTLYVAWRILERWTDPMKSVFGLGLLMMIPFYNFHSLKYNANTVLLPVWAASAYAFLRAFETRSALWGGLAGIAAGAAMLGKYWSVFLVAGFILAALIDRRRVAFFRSPAPYLMVLAGGLVLAPHIYWIATQGDTLAYAGRRLDGREPFSLGAVVTFMAAIVGYSGLALALWALLLRPTSAALRDIAKPEDAQRRLALLCFLLPNLLPILPAQWTGFHLTPLWTLPGYSLLPLVLLATPRITADRTAVSWMVSIVTVSSLAALALSPVVALTLHMNSDARPNDYGSLLAKDVSARWAGLSDRPLPLIFSCGRAPEVALAVAFDLRLPSRALFGKQGLGARTEILSRGGAIVGAADDPDCFQQGEAIAAMRRGTERFAATYRPTLFGVAGQPLSYTAYIVPPP
jgi:4-amino-4-deoxy-L-arabinose transferase-like glycosyltransferase